MIETSGDLLLITELMVRGSTASPRTENKTGSHGCWSCPSCAHLPSDRWVVLVRSREFRFSANCKNRRRR